MATSYELRKRARATLDGRILGSVWLYALLVLLIESAVLGVSSALFITSLIVTGPLTIGVEKYFLKGVRRDGDHKDLEPLFDGVKNNFGDNIIIGILVPIFIMLWTLLFIIPGIVKTFSYSMAFYLKIDHPEYTATQAITESRRLMRGNKFRLFCLGFSFIGWFFVGCLTLGIGFLWIMPYVRAANAEFYQDLISKDVTVEV